MIVNGAIHAPIVLQLGVAPSKVVYCHLIFFSVYINDLINILRKTGIGCHIINLFIACIWFADHKKLYATAIKFVLKILRDLLPEVQREQDENNVLSRKWTNYEW